MLHCVKRRGSRIACCGARGNTQALLTLLGLGPGVCSGRSGGTLPVGLCGTAARKGASGCLLLWATSDRPTPVTSSRLLKGASTRAKRAARPGSVSMSFQVLSARCLSPVLSRMLLCCCSCAPETEAMSSALSAQGTQDHSSLWAGSPLRGDDPGVVPGVAQVVWLNLSGDVPGDAQCLRNIAAFMRSRRGGER